MPKKRRKIKKTTLLPRLPSTRQQSKGTESEITRGIKQKHGSAAHCNPVYEFKFARRGHNQ